MDNTCDEYIQSVFKTELEPASQDYLDGPHDVISFLQSSDLVTDINVQ